MSWRSTLLTSLKKNAALPNAKYLQLATVRPNGRPANRTVVFRGFLGETDSVTFVTDARSHKVAEVAQSPFAEACWYLPTTREQFRMTGELQIVGASSVDPTLQQARSAAWRRMSEAARSQFAWPEPGIPRLEGDPPLDVEDKSILQDDSPPLATFCLVVMTVDEVDHLMLRGNRRFLHTRTEGSWHSREVNP